MLLGSSFQIDPAGVGSEWGLMWDLRPSLHQHSAQHKLVFSMATETTEKLASCHSYEMKILMFIFFTGRTAELMLHNQLAAVSSTF